MADLSVTVLLICAAHALHQKGTTAKAPVTLALKWRDLAISISGVHKRGRSLAMAAPSAPGQLSPYAESLEAEPLLMLECSIL